MVLLMILLKKKALRLPVHLIRLWLYIDEYSPPLESHDIKEVTFSATVSEPSAVFCYDKCYIFDVVFVYWKVFVWVLNKEICYWEWALRPLSRRFLDKSCNSLIRCRRPFWLISVSHAWTPSEFFKFFWTGPGALRPGINHQSQNWKKCCFLSKFN